MEDRCAHRGAALSQGRIRDGQIECPFHGFRYDDGGRCTLVPAEGADWHIPEHFCITTIRVREADGYVWTWRGPNIPTADLPPPPKMPLVSGMYYGETSSIWNCHYTRGIENVLDYSHLPFVHRTSIGAFVRDPRTRVRTEPFDGGFRFVQVVDGKDPDRQFVDFVYPTLWANKLGRSYVMGTTFVPVDETHTEVYVRWYHQMPKILHPLVNLWGQFSQYLVFNDDLPIVSSQRPTDAANATNDKLVPSDGGVVAYRKMHLAHREESQGQ
jgi:phenylpropionate dioxygenase-like ring-hydroxylating dioxygenase large terminal subunit